MIKIFRDIEECLTLQKAFEKEARHIKEEDLSLIKKASIVSQKGKILWVGETKKLPKSYSKTKSKEISLRGKTVLPGFIDCHTHLVHGGDRGDEFEMKFRGKTYQEIAATGGGIAKTVKCTRRLSEKELLQVAERRAKKFLSQGVTTVEMKSGYGLDLRNEIKILNVIRNIKSVRTIATYLGPHSKAPEYKTLQEMIEQIIAVDLPKIKKLNLSKRADIFIEDNYFTVEQAQLYFNKAKELGFNILAHTNQMKPSLGLKTSVQQGALSCDHMNYLSDEDIKLISNSQTTAVLIPTADFYLKTQFPRARALIDKGARVALATDFNPGSSPTQDIQFVGLLARSEMKMTLPEVLSAWTVGASFALGAHEELGSIQEGKVADFAILNSSWKELFYQVGFNNIDSVYINGKCSYKN